jgi:iron complex outermembrane receptor protein
MLAPCTAAPAPDQYATGSDPAGGLEEIVVTARKRAEPLQDTPLAVSAFSAADIEARSVGDIAALADFAPNVTFDATAPISGSSNAASVFVRGVGQTDFLITTDPGVGVYLDGVYLARSTGSVLDLLDVERVEVLRGPQGTLFGKNTIGGAVNVVTQPPGADLTGGGELTFGRFERRDVRGFVNVPLGESAALRISGTRREREGYARRILTGQPLGGQDRWTGRMALRWQPTAALELNLAGDYSRAEEDSPASSLLSGSRSASLGAPGTTFTGLLYNNLITGSNGLAPCRTPGFPVPFCGIPALIELPALPAGTRPYDARWLTGDAFTSNATGPSGSQYRIAGLAATLEWSAESLRVKSISAYREADLQFARDPDGSPLTIIHTSNTTATEQWSQEFQLAGETGGGRLKWLAGLYYLKEQGADAVTVPFSQETFDLINGLGLGCTLLPGLTGAPGPIGVPVCPNVFRVDNVGEGVTIDNTSAAVFGEATFALGDRVSITGGLRFTRDEKRVDISNYRTGGVPAALVAPRAERAFRELSPRLILEYRPVEDVLTYASFSKGFKSGGFNGRYGAPLPGPTSFEPEQVTSYEIGAKTEWFGRRLRANAALFRSFYDDVQVLVFDGGIPRTINAAEGRISGFELELTALVASRLRVQASYGWLDAGYTRLDPAVIGSFGTPIVNPLALGYRFVNSPRNTAAAAAQYELPLGRWGLMTLRGDLLSRSATANDAVNTPELIQPEVTTVNARLTIAPREGRWSASAFATNLTDRRYFTSGVADEPGFGQVEINAAPPREWGVSVAVSF